MKGIAHIDGEVEMYHTNKCPQCNSMNFTGTGRTGDLQVLWMCNTCGTSWITDTRPKSGVVTDEKVGIRDGVTADMPTVVKDRTKARFDLLPWGPIWKMAEVMTNGAVKPGRVAHNWRKGTEWSDYFSALQRHAALFQQGEDFEIDPDTGTRIDHMAAVMCCAAILLEYQMFNIGTDDRFPAGHPAYKGMKGNEPR